MTDPAREEKKLEVSASDAPRIVAMVMIAVAILLVLRMPVVSTPVGYLLIAIGATCAAVWLVVSA